MSNKLSHLQKLIDRIDEKYAMSDEDKLKKHYKYVKDNHFLISKQIIKDIFHNKKLEDLLWSKLLDEENKQIIIVYNEDKSNIEYVGFLNKEQINLNTIKLDDREIKFNKKNSEILIHNLNCKSEVSVDQSIYSFNKILNQSNYSDLTVKSLLE